MALVRVCLCACVGDTFSFYLILSLELTVSYASPVWDAVYLGVLCLISSCQRFSPINWFIDSTAFDGSSFSGFRDHTVNFDEAKVFFSSFISLCCVCSVLNCCRKVRTFACWMVGPVVPSPHRIRRKRRSDTQQVQQRYTNRMFSLFFSPNVS